MDYVHSGETACCVYPLMLSFIAKMQLVCPSYFRYNVSQKEASIMTLGKSLY